MLQTAAPVSHPTFFQRTPAVILALLLLVIPVGLSGDPVGTVFSGVFIVLLFFFPGYLLLAAAKTVSNGMGLVLSPVVGILCVTTLYDIFARASLQVYFFYLAAALSLAGIVVFILGIRREPVACSAEGYKAVIAGCLAALGIAPVYWRSGRFSNGEFVFHGPAGQDPLFHVTLLQRLLHHVPPDNFMFAGLRPAVYHYFDDQALALILRAQQALHPGTAGLFDLYDRCYPTLVYFLIGALAYIVGREILGTAKGGVLSMLLLLGAGGLGWSIGILQTAVHASHVGAVRERLFSSWTVWDGIDAIRPLVHRPAHYHSLLICLAAVAILLQRERTRRHWMLAGLLLGLMAGFNFTLAATFGGAAVLGALVLLLQHKRADAANLAWLASFIFVGSLPVNVEMMLARFHNMAPGFPFRGPNLEFSTSVWGKWVGLVVPGTLVPIVALILVPIMGYGVKLFGIGPLARLDLGGDRLRGVAMLLAVVFTISFVTGMFFPYQGIEVGIIFLQPTFWILGLFALRPLGNWLERNRRNWRAIALWGMLGLTWAQALLAFNFSYEVTFSQDSMRALEDLRTAASAEDVVAYLPSSITQKAVWTYTQQSTNFAIMAITGLDGYCSSQTYSIFNAVPGLSGKSSEEVLGKAERLYEQRRDDVDSFLRGSISADATARLANDRVRWIVVLGDAMQGISTSTPPWRRTREIVVYRLSP